MSSDLQPVDISSEEINLHLPLGQTIFLNHRIISIVVSLIRMK